MKYSLGAIPSPPDSRDYIVRAPGPGVPSLPSSFDLRRNLQPIRNQLDEGTCVAHAISAGLFAHAQRTRPNTQDPYNRILGVRSIYEEARAIAAREMRPILGEGCHPRDALKAAFSTGIDLESDRPYIPHQPGTPGPNAWKHCRENKVGSYAAVPLAFPSVKLAIYQYGGALAVITAWDGFMTPDTYGRVKETGTDNGRHAVYLCGWDDAAQSFLLRNSWGTDWGLSGYCYLPYSASLHESWVMTPQLSIYTPAPRPSWWPWFLPWGG